ncbi:MAG TPA: TonB-dependent receptor [Steroidobacteraceae bacterium]|nr:TonB-dependent receptor [Steroidobacteraceae bacterium]
MFSGYWSVRSSAGWLIGASTLLGAGAVLAADNGAGSGGDTAQLEEVIVTAERREESLSKTPLAITAVSADELAQADVVNVYQLQYLAPSMQVNQTAQGLYIAIRGITTYDTTSKGEPAIQFNTDGVPVNQPEEQALGFFDVQRVEVLSGPQGTLYGKSSTGGAVNVISNAPSLQEDASASVEVGNFNTKRFNAMWNQPLGGSWALRVAGVSNARNGYTDLVGAPGPNNNPGDEGSMAGRISLAGNISDVLKLRLTATTGRLSQVGNSSGQVKIDSDNKLTSYQVGLYNPWPAYVRDDFQGYHGQLDADVAAVHIAYLGSWTHYQTNNQQSSDVFGAATDGQAAAGSRELVRDSYDTTYHELRFSNRDAGRLEWVAGFNYFYEHVEENGHGFQIANTPAGACPALTSPWTSQVPGFSPYCNILAAGGDVNYQTNNNLLNYTTHESYGAFGHFVFAVTPDWHITLGVRDGSDRIARVGTFVVGVGIPFAPLPANAQGTLCISGQDCTSGFSLSFFNGGPLTTDAFPGGNNTGHGSDTKLVWNIGTDYQFTPAQFGYFRVATGYKSGGFNDFDPSNAGGFAPYKAEQMTSYEAGYKIHQSNLDFNSSLYFYNYSDMQVPGTYTVPGTTQNFAETVVTPTQLYGWENQAKWAVTGHDVLDLEADFEHSKYHGDLFEGNGNGNSFNINFNGKSLDRTPAAVFVAGYTHSFDLGDGARLALHADIRQSSKYYLTNFNNGVQYVQPSFTRSNANVRYVSGSGKLETEAFVNNIENKLQATSGVTPYAPGTVFPAGYSYGGYANVSQPRFFGLRETIHLN